MTFDGTPNWRVTLKRVGPPPKPSVFQLIGVRKKNSRYKTVDVRGETRKQARGRVLLDNPGWRVVRAVKAKPKGVRS